MIIDRIDDLDEFRLFGYTLKQMKDMERFARGHGWRPRMEKESNE